MPISWDKRKLFWSTILYGVLSLSGVAWAQQSVEISKEALQDKIRGAWAAQTIGVTYGFPVEFKFNSVRVPDDHELPWHEDYLYEMFTQNPNIYDDIYMDLRMKDWTRRQSPWQVLSLMRVTLFGSPIRSPDITC
jgi:hypothetical protein